MSDVDGKLIESLTVRIPAGLREQVEEIAARDRRRPSELVRLVLEDYVREQAQEEAANAA
jgi:predicted transcriptional regulator